MDINSTFLKISGSDIVYPYDINEHIVNNSVIKNVFFIIQKKNICD